MKVLRAGKHFFDEVSAQAAYGPLKVVPVHMCCGNFVQRETTFSKCLWTVDDSLFWTVSLDSCRYFDLTISLDSCLYLVLIVSLDIMLT